MIDGNCECPDESELVGDVCKCSTGYYMSNHDNGANICFNCDLLLDFDLPYFPECQNLETDNLISLNQLTTQSFECSSGCINCGELKCNECAINSNMVGGQCECPDESELVEDLCKCSAGYYMSNHDNGANICFNCDLLLEFDLPYFPECQNLDNNTLINSQAQNIQEGKGRFTNLDKILSKNNLNYLKLESKLKNNSNENSDLSTATKMIYLFILSSILVVCM